MHAAGVSQPPPPFWDSNTTGVVDVVTQGSSSLVNKAEGYLGIFLNKSDPTIKWCFQRASYRNLLRKVFELVTIVKI